MIDSQLASSGTVVVQTSDFYLARFPERLKSPTFGLVQAWIESNRSFDEFRLEAEAMARKWGVGEVRWWVDSATPAATVDALVAAGGHLCDSYLLLACEMDGRVAPTRPSTVETQVISDRSGFDDVSAVETEGWGRVAPDPASLERLYTEMMTDLEAGKGLTVVAYIDGVAAGVGRARFFDEVVRLLGAVTLPAMRRRGVYGTVLNARLGEAADRGANLAITRARPSTSAPTLLRAGFQEYNAESCYSLALMVD